MTSRSIVAACVLVVWLTTPGRGLADDGFVPVGAGGYATRLPAGARGPQTEIYRTDALRGLPMPPATLRRRNRIRRVHIMSTLASPLISRATHVIEIRNVPWRRGPAVAVLALHVVPGRYLGH